MDKEKNILFFKDFKTVRLDKLLREEFPSFPRKLIQKFFNKKSVLINGKSGKKGDFVKKGDVIHIKNIPSPDELKLKPNPLLPVKVIYKDKNVIILDKPSGIPSHPLDFKEKNTVANFLIAKFPEIKGVGEKPLEPGMINRLDIGTSGILLIARNQKMFERLKSEQKNGNIKKEYMALVIGEVADWGKIDKYIGNHPTDKRRMKVFTSSEEIKNFNAGKAVTVFEVYKKYRGYTLLKVKIEKGLRHQIRLHLASIGHPIAGDKTYQIKKFKKLDSTLLRHQFLHASGIEFFHPISKKHVRIFSPLPRELEEIQETLYLLSIPGMRESIRKGLKTPIDKSSRKIKW